MMLPAPLPGKVDVGLRPDVPSVPVEGSPDAKLLKCRHRFRQ